MENSTRFVVFILLTSFFVAACSDSENQKKIDSSSISPTIPNVESISKLDQNQGVVLNKFMQTESDTTFKALANDSILMSVDGKTLTKETFLKWVSLKRALMKNTISTNIPANEYDEAICEQMLATVTNEFARQIVASTYAENNGIIPSKRLVNLCRRGFMANAGIRNRSWDKALQKFSTEQQETINDRVMAEAILGAVHDTYMDKQTTDLDDVEVDALYSQYCDYNKRCSESNTVVWAQASNIWNRISSGESFEELAIHFDEDEYRSDDGVWGNFNANEFADEPEILKYVSLFRVGWVSPPIEADNGLMIMRVDSIDDGSGEIFDANYIPSSDAEFKISRIFLHLPLFMEEVDREQFAKECLNAKRTAEFNKFMRGLISKATIEFPCGTDIFDTEGESKRRQAMGN